MIPSRHLPLVVLTASFAVLPFACDDGPVHRVDPSMGGTTGSDSGSTTGGAGTSTGGYPYVPTGGNGSTVIELPNPLVDLCDGVLSMGGGGGGGEGGASSSETMPSVGKASGDLLIDDFEDGDSRVWGNGLSGHWESHNDFTEGGVQSPLGGRHEPDKDWTQDAASEPTFVEGREGGNAAHFTGSGFENWGSGQALFFATDGEGDDCIYDGSAFDGITFWAKGSVELTHPEEPAKQPQAFEHGKLKIHLVERDVVPNEVGGECDQETKDCWDSQRTRIELKECWQKYVIPFSELDRDGWSKLDSGELDLDELYQLVFEVAQFQTYDISLDDIEFYVGETPEAVSCED